MRALDATAVLVFRLAVVGILYLFLLAVARIVWRDLRQSAQASPQRDLSATLEIINPAHAGLSKGELIPLRSAICIGRERDNDVVVDEETVSSRHVRLAPRDGHWWIEDLGSTNGTLVNSRSVDGSRALKGGDIIQIGLVKLRFAV